MRLVEIYHVQPVQSINCAVNKKKCIYLHMCSVLTTKKDFFFHLFVSKNIFPSLALTRKLTGTLAECYFAHALTLKYSMNFKLNEIHEEGRDFFSSFRWGWRGVPCSPFYLLCEGDKRKEILLLLLTSGSAAFQSLRWFSSKGTWTPRGLDNFAPLA